MDSAKNYIEALKHTVDRVPLDKIEKIVDRLWESYLNDRQVFTLGNGGSAATASHFACDLAKGTINSTKKRFKVIALTDNVPLITAWSNDFSYEDIFVEQLKNLLQPEDIVIGISSSGDSLNVLHALKYAKSCSASTISICGFNGGKAREFSDECLIIDSDDTQQIEDIQLIMTHIIFRFLRERIRQN